MAGWNQKERPLLGNVFHIGDRIMLVNNLPVLSASKLWKMIKRADSDQRFDFIIRRMPFGKAYHIRRNFDYENIGLEVKDDSAEVGQTYTVSFKLSVLNSLPCFYPVCGSTFFCR